jgi:hypothetical protein
MRALLFVAALAGCAHDATMGGGSHGVVSYSSSTSTSTSTSTSPMAVESTHVYHSTATGAPIASRTSAAAELKHTDGKSGGLHGGNETLKAGLLTLAIGYGSTVAIGQIVDATLIGDFENAVGAGGVIDRLWVPVLGPWSAIIYNETTVSDNCSDPTILAQYPGFSCNLLHQSSLFIFAGAAAQTIGFGVAMYGLLKPPAPHARSEKQLVLVPHGGPASAGLTLSGSF